MSAIAFPKESLAPAEHPPLRKQDVPAQAATYLAEWCRASAIPVRTFTDAALSLLSAFPWNGDGRELRAFVVTIAAHARGPVLGPDEVLAHIRLESGALAAYRLSLKEARRRFEREYIATVLDHHHGRMDSAARALGIQRTNLYRKLRQLDVARRIKTDTRSRRVASDTENAGRR